MATSTGKGEQHRKLHPPFAQPDPGRRATPHTAETPEILDEAETLPFIDRFVDDLPLIDDFLLQLESSEPAYVAEAMAQTEHSPRVPAVPPETDSEGWAAADWQSYDWSGVASLAPPAPEAAAAHAAWATTNWEAGRGGPSNRSTHLREDDVAAALDEMARRIRSGELSLQQFRGSPPEAALAAAFASVLRIRG